MAYTCANCRIFVPDGVLHTCNAIPSYSTHPTHVPDSLDFAGYYLRIAVALERIAAALERGPQ